MSNNLKLVDASTDAGVGFARRFETVLVLTEEKQHELAAKCDVTPRSIYDWTRGVVPFKANLAALDRETSFSPSYLLAPWPAPEIKGLNYWARTRAPKYRRARFAAYATLLGHVYRHVSTLPTTAIDQQNRGTLSASPERAAKVVRDTTRLGEAPVDTLALAESLGVVVVFGPPSIFELDGFSAWIDGHPTIVLNPAHLESARSDLFRIWHTVGHELGHLFMHDLELGAVSKSIPGREADAESFSAALRMPATESFNDSLQRAVRTYGWEALTRLSNLYKVPVRDLLTAAKVRGLENGKYIDKRALWAATDGVDLQRTDQTPVPPPLRLLSSSIDDLCLARGYSRTDFAREIGIPSRYVELMAATFTDQVDLERVGLGEAIGS